MTNVFYHGVDRHISQNEKKKIDDAFHIKPLVILDYLPLIILFLLTKRQLILTKELGALLTVGRGKATITHNDKQVIEIVNTLGLSIADDLIHGLNSCQDFLQKRRFIFNVHKMRVL